MGKRILVVDDSPLVLDIIRKLLVDNGYEIFTASNGIEAIEKAFRELPDLILLDVMMPRMNGYQACRLLKSDPETCAIPIIMLTVKDQASDKYWGIKTGANAYLSKDFIPTTLLKTLEDLIQDKRAISLARSLIREHSNINAVDIISKVNDLLDKKLFEATVLNEMSSLIERGIDDFKDIVNTVMGTLAKILDYDVAAIVAIEQYDIECFFKINHPVSEQYLKEVQEYTKTFLKGNDIDVSLLETTAVFDADKIKQSGDTKKQSIAFFDVPIKYANKLGGLIVLAHNVSERIDSKEEAFFKIVVKQAYVIIDNSWLYSKVKKLAITDSLTGIYNHGFLYESLCKEYARTKRFNLPLSLLMLDIDYFKKVNDTYGHLAGDSVLRKVSQIFKNTIRMYDILGRYGGEEFMVILPETNIKDGVYLAERMRKEVEQYNFGKDNDGIRCTISTGVAGYQDSEVKSIEDLISRADKALYRAKTEGRNRVCVL